MTPSTVACVVAISFPISILLSVTGAPSEPLFQCVERGSADSTSPALAGSARTLLCMGCPVGYVRIMPILIRYAPSSLTREQYDRVNEILQENGPDGPPPPLQLHVMFGEEPDLRVSEVWASEDAWQQAWDGGLKAALSAAGVELPEPEKFPVHEVWGSRVPDG